MRYTRRNLFTMTTINTNTLLSAPFYNRYRINRLVSRLAAQQARDERLRRRYAMSQCFRNTEFVFLYLWSDRERILFALFVFLFTFSL